MNVGHVRDRATAVACTATIAVAVWLSACATAGGGSPPESRSADREAPTPVQVDNGNTSDVVVYALSRGQYYRLGEVTAHQRATLDLPRQLRAVSSLRLVADPIGSRTAYFSEQFLFSPGDTIMLNVGPRMNLSSVSVRSGRR